MNYYLIAGEASGDLHAANLMKALQQEDDAATFRCWGGDLMAAAGGHLVKHYKELAFMGFWEVVKNLRTIAKNLDFCKKDITTNLPDVLILIDYSGFNLRIAQWAKTIGLKVFYYISPQVWASRQSRVKKIKKYVDKLFVILPFEKDFYQQFDLEVDFVGHPLLDAIAEFQTPNATPLHFDKTFSSSNKAQGLEKERTPSQLDKIASDNEPLCFGKPIIALLPGSRQQEIKVVLKIMLPLAHQFSNYQFIIAIAPAIPISFYEQIIAQSGLPENTVFLVRDQTYNLLNQSKAAIVTSGTATLETALFEVPQVVCYKGSWLTYQIAKRIIKVPYISLVNLIANQPLVKELIQNDLTVANLKEELEYLLSNQKSKELKLAYRQIKKQLGDVGASKRAAKLMVSYLRSYD